MTNFKLTGICILIFGAFAFGQNPAKDPDVVSLNGTWALDKARSGAGGGLRVQFADAVMTIVQTEREIRTTTRIKNNGKETVEDATYYLDGRKEKTSNGGEVKTKWTGKKLVITTKSVIRALTIGGTHPEMQTKEEWEVSKDGNTLTRTLSGSASLGMPAPPKSRFVYSRI